MTGWRQSRAVALGVVSGFLIIQLAVPISRFANDGATRFGWQMYSSAEPAPTFVVFTPTGDLEIDLEDFVAATRAEVDLSRHLPPHLCEVVPGAIRVVWEDGSHSC